MFRFMSGLVFVVIDIALTFQELAFQSNDNMGMMIVRLVLIILCAIVALVFFRNSINKHR